VLQRSLEPKQYTSVHFAETLQLHDLSPSIGSVGDAYDNALAETTIGLYKTECIRDDSPFRRGPLTGLGNLEAITADWVHWYNTSRLMHRLGPTTTRRGRGRLLCTNP
jgi:putative transposase